MNFFHQIAVRETIESIVVAIVLAFVFKSFEAEAYIIPTGSMAPTLRGEHYDVVCEQCGDRYQSGWLDGRPIYRLYCPMCGHSLSLKANDIDDQPYDGDRILVNKYIYDFSEPRRWDVIVFKNPRTPSKTTSSDFVDCRTNPFRSSLATSTLTIGTTKNSRIGRLPKRNRKKSRR